MNGIIHTCSHPFDDDVHFRLPEEQIAQDIFSYIECLFNIIKPKKVFFMAVDGVAPRAKMNQQRARRFRSARDALEREKQAKNRGEILPDEPRFDSNCITPGTDFMVRLQKHLQYFVAYKISTDDLWKNIKVILSGHETPGEGEHKIMDFIRAERSKPGYDPYTRHCLYGLDADLIMLGMSSHEPYFSLLREEVKFSRSKSKNSVQKINPSAITFHLLHLTLLRDYLDNEFSALKGDKLPYGYDLESIIDDWLLMSFLCGNDFIPHLPHFTIAKNALATLYKTYIQVAPTLDGYLNDKGNLNLPRFQKFLTKLSEIDIENFEETNADLKYFASKRGENPYLPSKTKITNNANNGICTNGKSADTKNLYEFKAFYEPSNSENDESTNSPESDTLESDEDTLDEEFRLHKRNYYMTKMNYGEIDSDVLKEQAYCYIKAIQWNLHYYYNGCPSWSWFYPHHYAPYISDVKSFQDIDLTFELGQPFKPYEQLLGVLPIASKQFLPKAYQRLMIDESSPLKDCFPDNFELDMDGKQQSWEAVVVIPFIDENKLIKAVQDCEGQLSDHDRLQNKHGPHLMFTYSPEKQPAFPSTLPGRLPDIQINYAQVTPVNKDAYLLPINQIKKGLLDGINLDTYVPGFPTLRTLEYTSNLEKAKVRVFEFASNGFNFILELKPRPMESIEKIVADYLNSEVYIDWPHLKLAKVIQICDGIKTYYYKRELTCEKKCDERGLRDYNNQLRNLRENLLSKKGIRIGTNPILFYVQLFVGSKYMVKPNGNVSLEKQWSENEIGIPFQTTLKDVKILTKMESTHRTLHDMFPLNKKCFILNENYYGDCAEIVQVMPQKNKVKVRIYLVSEPDLGEVKDRMFDLVKREYLTNWHMAQRLDMNAHLLSRLTGSVMVLTKEKDRVNIGLNLKFNSRREEVPGYSKKRDDTWLFSQKTLKLIEEYYEKFPEIFISLSQCADQDCFACEDLFTDEDAEEKILKVAQWVKSLPHQSLIRQKFDAESLDGCVVKCIEDTLDSHKVFASTYEPLEILLPPNQIYIPSNSLGLCPPDSMATFNLFDRVVNVKEGLPVPLGAKGIVIALPKIKIGEPEYYVDVVFDDIFPGGLEISCSKNRGYRLHPSHLINITYGKRMGGYGVKEVCEMAPIQPPNDYRDKRINYKHNEPKKLINLNFNQRSLNDRSSKSFNNAPIGNNFYHPNQVQNYQKERNNRGESARIINHSPQSRFQDPRIVMQPRIPVLPLRPQQPNILEMLINSVNPSEPRHRSITAQQLIDSAKNSKGSAINELNKLCIDKYNNQPTYNVIRSDPAKITVVNLKMPDGTVFSYQIPSDMTDESAKESAAQKTLNRLNLVSAPLPPMPPEGWMQSKLERDQFNVPKKQELGGGSTYNINVVKLQLSNGKNIDRSQNSKPNLFFNQRVLFVPQRPRVPPPFSNEQNYSTNNLNRGINHIHNLENQPTPYAHQKHQFRHLQHLAERQDQPKNGTKEAANRPMFVPVQVARKNQATRDRNRSGNNDVVAQSESKDGVKNPSQVIPPTTKAPKATTPKKKKPRSRVLVNFNATKANSASKGGKK